MSGEAVLNILKSMRFAEELTDFSWAELSDGASETFNRRKNAFSANLI